MGIFEKPLGKRQFYMDRIEVIKKAYPNVTQMAQDTGINYETLTRNRLKPGKVGSMTLNELWALQRHGYYSDADLLKIVRWHE